MRKKIVNATITSLCIALAAAPFTSAYYTNGFKLVGGVKDRLYYIDGAAQNPFFNSIVAGMDNWNTINPISTSTTDVNFSRSASNANSQIDIYTDNYGSIGWVGHTYFYGSSGIEDSFPNAPSYNYSYAKIRLNSDPYQILKNTWAAIAAHEIGHALGLNHNNDIAADALMKEYIAQYSYPSSITMDERDGIRYLYN